MKTILIIEDNNEVRENAAEILELSDYKVLTAENGKQGVEMALQAKPDLIICDIMMPVLDGYGVLHLLNKHIETAAIPFIFLTAKSEKGDIRKGMSSGADDYLTKPFDGIELLNAVDVRLKKADQLKQSYNAELEKLKGLMHAPKNEDGLQLTSEERDVYNFKKNHTVYREGQRPKEVYFIVSGKVKTSKIHPDGKTFITNIFGPSDFVGYAPILENTNYYDTADVLEDATLMIIPKEHFLELITNNTGVAKQFIQLIAHNVSEKEEALMNMAYNSLRKKVAYGIIQLVDLYKAENNAAVLTISRENLANSIGVATESLIRTLASFKDENLIDIQKGKIVVLNEKKIRNLPF